MEFENSAAWSESFANFCDEFADCFKRVETRQCAAMYMRGLLAEVERKNCWQLAEKMGHNDPQKMQRMLYESQWSADEACQKLRAGVKQRLGYEPGIGVIDESGFVKRGDKSAGVGRQYCGRLGKVENCQVGVFLGYIAPSGYSFLDRELYLPQDWCEDAQRRVEAKIPADIGFATKPQLAQRMLARSWAEGIPMQWVVADSTYGNSPSLRNFIHQQQRYYVMEVPKTLHVRVSGNEPAQVASDLISTLDPAQWTRLAFDFGEKGVIFYDWMALRVTPTTDEVGEQWLLLRRSDEGEITYYLSNTPTDISLSTLAEIASSRWRIELILKEAKQETGLDEYEVRYWHSWYRHITLSMMAHTWLTFMRQEEREKKSFACLVDLQFCRTATLAEYPVADTNTFC